MQGDITKAFRTKINPPNLPSVLNTEWAPPAPRYTVDTLMPLRIEVADFAMRSQAKAAGARWNPTKQRWFIQYGKIVGTPLEKHIQIDDKG